MGRGEEGACEVCDMYMMHLSMQGLYRLFMLRKLTMSDNEITRLSNDLGQLTNLQELDVSRNGSSLAQFTKLLTFVEALCSRLT